MRILYFHRTLGGGAEAIHIDGMIDAFADLGHTVFSIPSRGTGDQIRAHRSTSRAVRLLRRGPSMLYELGELAHNAKTYAMLAAAIQKETPDLLYARHNLFTLSPVAAARRYGIPLFLEVNTPYAYQRAAYERLALRRLASRLEVAAWKGATVVGCVSTPLQRYLVEKGVERNRIVVLPNGVDLKLFRSIPSGGVRSPEARRAVHIVGFLGSLRRWHGVDFLLDAMAPLLKADSRVRCVIAGDGPEKGALEFQAKGLGIAGLVQFVGNVPHEHVPETIAGFDVAVSLQSPFYQSPMKIVEYMAASRAVLAPDQENIRDLIEPGRQGLLFAPADRNAFREAVRLLLSDPTLRHRLGVEARARVEARHTWLHIAEAVTKCAGRTRTAEGQERHEV